MKLEEFDDSVIEEMKKNRFPWCLLGKDEQACMDAAKIEMDIEYMIAGSETEIWHRKACGAPSFASGIYRIPESYTKPVDPFEYHEIRRDRHGDYVILFSDLSCPLDVVSRKPNYVATKIKLTLPSGEVGYILQSRSHIEFVDTNLVDRDALNNANLLDVTEEPVQVILRK